MDITTQTKVKNTFVLAVRVTTYPSSNRIPVEALVETLKMIPSDRKSIRQ